MSTATLTSLAILKVNIDRGNDYLDYLRPFILQVLVDHHPDPITNEVISDLIREQFGLEIPKRTVEIVLKRLFRKHIIKRENRVYRITGGLPDPKITAKMSEARRHIDAVVFGLQQFTQNGVKPISSYEEAVTAICAFLAEFDVTCLRAFLQGTVIPRLEGTHKAEIVLVSEYVQHLKRNSPERFDSFLILVQGNMLANALLCPDLHKASKTYQKVKFYLDTPLLIRTFGLEGESRQSASRELIALLSKLGGKVLAFSHTRRELYDVLRGTAANLDTPGAHSPMINEAKKRGTTKSDFLLIAETIDEKLGESGIGVEDTPRYMDAFQIDETVFEQVLDDELSYNNPRAKKYDINSVRSIYAVRGNKSAFSLESARAVFVTSNTPFARAAWEYGKNRESSRDVSAVISDFSLANMAWLKSPIEAPEIPKTQLLAFCYAALRPSRELLGKYMKEIDRLEKEERITERDHQVLRSIHLVEREIVHLTLGEDTALTEDIIMHTLDSAIAAIKIEEAEKLKQEQVAHRETQETLHSQQVRNKEILKSISQRCRKEARQLAWIFSLSIVFVVVAGNIFDVLGLQQISPVIGWALVSLILAITTPTLSLLNQISGMSVKSLHELVENRCYTWLLNYRAKTYDVDLSAFDVN